MPRFGFRNEMSERNIIARKVILAQKRILYIILSTSPINSYLINHNHCQINAAVGLTPTREFDKNPEDKVTVYMTER